MEKHQDWNTRRRTGKSEPIIVEGIHDAIIDEGLWTRVQKVNELQKNSFSSNRNFNGNFLLTGILKCPKCGAGTVMSKTKREIVMITIYIICVKLITIRDQVYVAQI